MELQLLHRRQPSVARSLGGCPDQGPQDRFRHVARGGFQDSLTKPDPTVRVEEPDEPGVALEPHPACGREGAPERDPDSIGDEGADGCHAVTPPSARPIAKSRPWTSARRAVVLSTRLS